MLDFYCTVVLLQYNAHIYLFIIKCLIFPVLWYYYISNILLMFIY